jgi:hypothetical protein
MNLTHEDATYQTAALAACVNTMPYLTLLEHVQVLKTRAEMLQQGEAPLVPVAHLNPLDNEMEVAYKELHTGALNHLLFVDRKFPHGTTDSLYKTVRVPLYMLKLKDDY